MGIEQKKISLKESDLIQNEFVFTDTWPSVWVLKSAIQRHEVRVKCSSSDRRQHLQSDMLEIYLT